jgi:hypothetical protein
MRTFSPRFLYWALLWGSYLLLSWGCIVVTSKFDLGFNGRIDPVALSVLPMLVLSQLISVRVLRWLGLLGENRTIEVIKRGGSAPQDVTSTLPEFTIKDSPGLFVGLASICTRAALVCLLGVLLLPAVPGTKIYGFLIVGSFGLFGLLFWIGAFFIWLGYDYSGFLIARVDPRGIKGPGSFWCKSVGWKDIDRCEVITLSNSLGPLPAQFAFKDNSGKVLLNVYMQQERREGIELLKAAVECYLKQSADGKHG